MGYYDNDPRVTQVDPNNDTNYTVSMPDGVWRVTRDDWDSGDPAWSAFPPPGSSRQGFRMRYPDEAIGLVLDNGGRS